MNLLAYAGITHRARAILAEVSSFSLQLLHLPGEAARRMRICESETEERRPDASLATVLAYNSGQDLIWRRLSHLHHFGCC